jgi:hypothetical protein
VVDEAHLFGAGLRLHSEVEVAMDEPCLIVRDRVTNGTTSPKEFELLYHLNFGPPLLGDGAVLEAPYTVVAPRDAEAAGGIRRFSRFGPPEPGWTEQCFFMQLAGRGPRKETSVLLTAPRGDVALEVGYEVRSLPCFSLWKNTASEAEGYVVGLEPGTNFPNHRSFERERGRVKTLRPGRSWKDELRFTLHQGKGEVGRIRSAIRKEASRGTVSKVPIDRFSPG